MHHVTHLQSFVGAEVVEVVVMGHALVEIPQRVLPRDQELQNHLHQLFSLEGEKMSVSFLSFISIPYDIYSTLFLCSLTHGHSLSVLFAVWGQDGGCVTAATDAANLIFTGQEVLFLKRQRSEVRRRLNVSGGQSANR